MNTEKLDRIILSKEDVDLLFGWRDNHKDYVRNFKSALKEGMIVVEDYHTQIFKDEGTHYRYTILLDGIRVYELYWSKANRIGVVTYSKMEFSKEDETGYNNSIISLHASIMAYMEYYSDNKEYVSVREVETSKNKVRTKKKNKSKKKSPIRIKKKVYIVKVDKDATIVDEKRYERKVESWTVSGHWRHYKDGRKVWIEPYSKGEGETTPKNYKL